MTVKEGAGPGSQTLTKSIRFFLLKVLSVFLAAWHPGSTFERKNGHKDDEYPVKDDNPDRCKTIRPYRKCSLIPQDLTDAFFDQPIGTLVRWGCFTNSDMNSCCSDFGICERTKRYATRRGDTD